MAGELGPDENRHVSGLYTQMLVSYLQERLSPAAMGRVLLRGGESRDLEELSNISSWSSYQQFRRLLQEARLESDSVPDVLQSHYAMRTQNPEIAQTCTRWVRRAPFSAWAMARTPWCRSDATL